MSRNCDIFTVDHPQTPVYIYPTKLNSLVQFRKVSPLPILMPASRAIRYHDAIINHYVVAQTSKATDHGSNDRAVTENHCATSGAQPPPHARSG